MSYNVLSHSHWGLGQFFGGGGGVVEIPGGGESKKRQSPDFRSPEVGISAKGRAGKCECNGGKMTNVMWGKRTNEMAGK